MFLVFEGTDGSGTSTQADLLAQRLQKKGRSVLHTREPSSFPLGKMLRKALSSEITLSPSAFQLLFFADRNDHLEKEILPALGKGCIVICERYCWSSIAYGKSTGVSSDLLHTLTHQCLIPDYTFFLSLSAEDSLQRITERGEGREHFETHSVLSEVHAVMTELVEQCAFTKKASLLDASESREQIASRIDMLLAPLLFAESFAPV